MSLLLEVNLSEVGKKDAHRFTTEDQTLLHRRNTSFLFHLLFDFGYLSMTSDQITVYLLDSDPSAGRCNLHTVISG